MRVGVLMIEIKKTNKHKNIRSPFFKNFGMMFQIVGSSSVKLKAQGSWMILVFLIFIQPYCTEVCILALK